MRQYKSKVKDRILATLIGAVIIIILFSIFKGQNARLLIVMVTGYLQSYVNEYKYRMIFVTVCGYRYGSSSRKYSENLQLKEL